MNRTQLKWRLANPEFVRLGVAKNCLGGCYEPAPEVNSSAAFWRHEHGKDHEMQAGKHLGHALEIAAQPPEQG